MTEGSPAGQPENRGSPEPGSYEAEAAEIESVFKRKLAGLRRRVRPWEMAAAVRALREEKQATLAALKERRAWDRHSKKPTRPGARAHSKPQRPKPEPL